MCVRFAVVIVVEFHLTQGVVCFQKSHEPWDANKCTPTMQYTERTQYKVRNIKKECWNIIVSFYTSVILCDLLGTLLLSTINCEIINKRVIWQRDGLHYLSKYTPGLYSQTTYLRISWSLEALGEAVMIIISFWHVTGISTALLPKVPVKFQSDWKSLNQNLAASRLHEILR